MLTCKTIKSVWVSVYSKLYITILLTVQNILTRDQAKSVKQNALELLAKIKLLVEI